MFLFKIPPAWGVVIWFGFISFGLVFVKEEVLRWVASTKLAQAQYRRRVILVGASEETARMEAELKAKSEEEVEILARLDLSEEPVRGPGGDAARAFRQWGDPQREARLF